MSRPKRSLVSEALAAEDNDVITPSRDNVITLPAEPEAPAPKAPPSRKAEGVRHGYRATLYLPREAQYKIREIALMKRCKPHDVLVEAVAEMFEKYNAADLADELRRSRDSVST
jgi:hypothetical protein